MSGELVLVSPAARVLEGWAGYGARGLLQDCVSRAAFRALAEHWQRPST